MCHDDTEIERIVGTVVVTMAGLGVVAAILLATIGRSVLPSLFNVPDTLIGLTQTTIVIFAVQTAIDIVTRATHSCMEGLQRTDLARLADAVRRTAVAVAVCSAALLGGDLVDVATASATASLVGTVVSWWMLRGKTKVRLRSFSTEAVHRLTCYGIAVGGLRPLGVIHRTIDRMVVGSVLGPAAVTAVEVATNLQSGADAVLGASSYAVNPRVVAERSRRPPDSSRARRAGDPTLAAGVHTGHGVRGATEPTAHRGLARRRRSGRGGGPRVGRRHLHDAGGAAPGRIECARRGGSSGDRLASRDISIVVNIAASIVLVRVVGVVGAFQATIVASLVLFRFSPDQHSTMSHLVVESSSVAASYPGLHRRCYCSQDSPCFSRCPSDTPITLLLALRRRHRRDPGNDRDRVAETILSRRSSRYLARPASRIGMRAV